MEENAVNIDQLEVEEAGISPQSFNENPMGAAFTIDAPLPPIPQEPPIEGEEDVLRIQSGQPDSLEHRRNGGCDSSCMEQIYK